MKPPLKKIILLVVGLALGLALAVRVLDVAETSDTSQQSGPAALTSPIKDSDTNTTQQEPSQTERRRGSESNAQPRNQQRLSADNAPIAEGREARQTQPEFRRQLPSEPETNPANTGKVHGVDFSVVGQPFPVSESVLAECRPKPGMHPSSSCEPNKKLLDEMAEEPREDTWASAAEQSIRALVEFEPGTERPRPVTYTIRNLECRRSICFLEAASTMSMFATELYFFEKTSGLRAGYAIHSREINEHGGTVHVSLWPFVRK